MDAKPLVEFTIKEAIGEFLDAGVMQRVWYFYAEHLPGLEVPEGKVVRVTFDFELDNLPE